MQIVKHLAIGLILTIVVLFLHRYVAWFLHLIDHGHNYILNLLYSVIPSTPFGRLPEQTLALVLIPFFIALIPWLLLKLFSGRGYYNFGFCFWLVWTLLVAVLFI